MIWLSVKYHNFFSFQNVTSPPYAVNVPFISSHLKVSMWSLEPNLSTWQFYFLCRLFFNLVFFTWSWIQSFFKEILLVIRNCCITCPKLNGFSGELSFGAADLCRRCSYLKIVFYSNLRQSILLNKKVDTCPLVDKNLSAWIELSVWRCKRCYEHSMVKFVPRAIIQYLIYACALLNKRELKKAVHQPISLTAF